MPIDAPVLEVAILDVRDGARDEFEAAFRDASGIIASMPGYISHELRRCVEATNRYVLLVHWRSLEDHTIGFRQSADYQRWRSLLHHFYDPFPVVEHYGPSLLDERST
jgi:heme-degrading monooxygenase HmoA